MPPSAFAIWRNKQSLRSDLVPGWLPILIPYTYHYFTLKGQLGSLEHSSASCSKGHAALCVCEGVRATTAGGSLLHQGLWALASPVCAAIQTNHIDAFITVLFTWPFVAAMVLLPRWYVTRRTQLVALLRLCVMCIPALLTWAQTLEHMQQELAARGSWVDTPGSTLDTVASSLGLAEYQLKQLLALAAVCWTSHALLLPPAWEAPVSAVNALAFASCLGRVGLALGHSMWPWAAGLAVAAAVLCFLLPLWSAVRRERRLQAQYQQLMAAQEVVVDPAAASSSSQGASTKGEPPTPEQTAGGPGPSRPALQTPGSSGDATNQPLDSGTTAAGGAGNAPVCLPKKLALAAGHTAMCGLYTSAGRSQQLSLSVVASFASADEASSSHHRSRGRAAAVLQAAQEALGLVCAAATHVVTLPTAATPHVQQQHQRPVGVMASVYLDLSYGTEAPLGAAAGSATTPAAGVLVRLVSVEDGADRVQLLLVASQQLMGGLQDSSSTEGMLREWWAAVQQVLVTSVLGITSVTSSSVTACITHAADQGHVTGTGGSGSGTDWHPERSNTGGVAVISGGLAGGTQLQGPVGGVAGSVYEQDVVPNGGAVTRTSGNPFGSGQRPPPGSSSQQPSSMASCALQWAFQLQWHAPMCLPDPGPEAVEAPELLLQLALQPAPGSSVGCNPYSSVAGNRAFFAAAVATGSPGGASPANRSHTEAPAAAAATAAAPASAAAGMATDPGAQRLAQSPAQLRGNLGNLVTFLVTNEAATSCWSWSEEEVLGLAAAQQQPSPSGGVPQQTTAEGASGTSGALPVAVQLQLPQGLSSSAVHELLLTHRLPPPTHSGDGHEEPLQALALVPLCVLPTAAYQEVEQQLLPCMWAEAHGLVSRGSGQAGAPSEGAGSNSSSLQDYAAAFVGSSVTGGAVPPEVAAAEALTWCHWCQLAGDMNRAASLSRLLTGQALLLEVTPEQQAAVLLCCQELQELAGRLLGFFLSHHLVACAVAVLLQMPPDLQQGYTAAVQQELAGRVAARQQQQQQQQEEEGEDAQLQPRHSTGTVHDEPGVRGAPVVSDRALSQLM